MYYICITKHVCILTLHKGQCTRSIITSNFFCYYRETRFSPLEPLCPRKPFPFPRFLLRDGEENTAVRECVCFRGKNWSWRPGSHSKFPVFPSSLQGGQFSTSYLWGNVNGMDLRPVPLNSVSTGIYKTSD